MSSLLGYRGLEPPGIEDHYEIYHELEHIVELTGQIFTHRTCEPGRERHKKSSRPFEDNYEPKERFGPHGLQAGCYTQFSKTVPEVVKVTVGLVNDGLGVNTPVDFWVPHFVLQESSFFRSHLKGERGHEQIGTIDRPSSLFPLVILLLKLRWVLRVHTYLSGCDVRTVSLRRFLLALLSVTTDAKGPKTPETMLDLLNESLRDRLGSFWPKFVNWVGLHDQRPSVEHLERSQLQGTNHTTASNAFLWQVVDDIWLSHLSQQPLASNNAMAVMSELDYYGVARPLVSLDLKGILSWVAAPNASKHRFQRAAQRQAHHLCIALEVSDELTMQELAEEEVVEAVCHIAGHPKTFNDGLRQRVRDVFPMRCSELVERNQMERFFSFSAHSRDCGRLMNVHIEGMRDRGLPWLFSNQPVKFRQAAEVWPSKLPPPTLYPFDAVVSPRKSRSMGKTF